jgi:CDP-diacylglycerol--serine O-phosphatidyltransferase
MTESKWQQTIQTYLPNSITFLSLASGFTSIIFAAQEMIFPAVSCILFSVLLDTLDGYLARKLNTASVFGKQLDSLVDIVSFGVAPILIVWQHLNLKAEINFWVLPIFIVQILSGAYRLARFNLQFPKQSSNEKTIGLTITQSGLIFMLAVLSDLSTESYNLPVWIYLLLSLFLSFLMVSKLILPSFGWYAPPRKYLFLYVILGFSLAYFSSIFTVLLVFYLGGLVVSISRLVLT